MSSGFFDLPGPDGTGLVSMFLPHAYELFCHPQSLLLESLLLRRKGDNAGNYTIGKERILPPHLCAPLTHQVGSHSHLLCDSCRCEFKFIDIMFNLALNVWNKEKEKAWLVSGQVMLICTCFMSQVSELINVLRSLYFYFCSALDSRVSLPSSLHSTQMCQECSRN